MTTALTGGAPVATTTTTDAAVDAAVQQAVVDAAVQQAVVDAAVEQAVADSTVAATANATETVTDGTTVTTIGAVSGDQVVLADGSIGTLA